MALIGLGSPLFAGPDTPEIPNPEEEAAPVLNSPILSWQFNGTLERVRDTLIDLLKKDGLSLKEENREAGTFMTDLVNFNAKKFGVNVSIPPPRVNPKYPWLQSIAVSNGRFGLEGRLIAVGPESTRLDLRALLEVQAMNTKKGELTWTPRYSNGTIEHQYFSRLAVSLPPPPSGESAPR
jgi:hypothetical protein